MKLGETTNISAGSIQNVSSNTSKSSWTSTPAILWTIIGISVICLGFISYKYITMPNVEKIQREADAWKSKYELVLKEYQLSKNVYENTISEFQKKFDMLNKEYQKNKKVSNAKISEIQKKFEVLQKEYEKMKKEGSNVKAPTTKKERVDRLHNLGYNPIIQ